MNVLITNSARRYIGEAAHCFDLTEQLLADGHQVMLVVRRGSELDNRVSARRLQMWRLGFQHGFGWFSDLRDLWRLRWLIRAFRADVVHCHRGKDHWLAAAALALAGRPNVPLIRTRHVVMPMQQHAANRWLFGKATDYVIAVSEEAARSLGGLWNLLSDKMRVIYSSVDSVAFRPSRRSMDWRREIGVKPDEKLIGLIARFQGIKGQEVLLRAAAKIIEAVPNAKILLAGRGRAQRRAKYLKLAEQLVIRDHVITEETLEDVPTALASLDVGVVASLGSEGSSRITYEYMASGTPIVATRVGCIPEVLVNEETGLLVDPKEPEQLADAVIRVLTDEPLRERMRAAALERVESFYNRQRWLSEILDVYNTAIAGKAR